MSTPSPFRVGFIGAGGIARHQMNLLRKIPGVQVICAADPNQELFLKLTEEQQVKKCYTDYRKMLAEQQGELDAISVCTPNGLHCENTVAALKTGLHVMVEKPMAMNAKECQKMIDAAETAGKQLICGFQWRFNPKATLLRRQAEEGVFGPIKYVRVQALRRRGIPNWGVFGRKDLQGGGPMIDIGVHCAEMAHFVMGMPEPVAASGMTATYLGDKPMKGLCAWSNWDHKTYTVEDLAVGFVRFADGAVMVIESSFAAHIEKDVWNFQIMGEQGGATFDPLAIFKDEHGYQWNESPFYAGDDDHFLLKMRHFVGVCRDGQPNRSSGHHGMMVQKILDGIYKSAELGKEVRIS